MGGTDYFVSKLILWLWRLKTKPFLYAVARSVYRVCGLKVVLKKPLSKILGADYAHAAMAVHYLGAKPGSCLVVGCNRGRECGYFIKLGASYVDGVDIIDDIGSDYSRAGVMYYKLSAENMNTIRSDFYDIVYSYATMEHIGRIDLAFSQMCRVARPGGIIYSVAGPLWNSRYGHHKQDFFKDYPWIHLRMSKEEIVDYCKAKHIYDPAGTDMKHHIEYMLNPSFFNKLFSKKYIEVCGALRGVDIIRNELVFEEEKGLAPNIYAQLMPKGYARRELLAMVHIFIGRKNG